MVLRYVMTASADMSRLSEPAPPRRVDGDLSPRRLALLSGGRRTWRQSDARRGFQTCRLEISSTAKPHRQIFARRKEWRRLSTPINSAGCRRLSPIRLCLTGAAPTSLRSSTPSCAAPPSQRRSQLSYTYIPNSNTTRCHFENYLAQDFGNWLAWSPAGTSARPADSR